MWNPTDPPAQRRRRAHRGLHPRGDRSRPHQRTQHGAGLSNVGTIIGDLPNDDVLDLDLLADVAKNYPVAIAQRLGYLIDFMATEIDVQVDLHELARLAAGRDYVPLSPYPPIDGDRDPRWRVVLNDVVEHDL